MFEFILGLVIGAAFSPFWISLWNKAKDRLFTKSE